jgi:hypothetical protein
MGDRCSKYTISDTLALDVMLKSMIENKIP